MKGLPYLVMLLLLAFSSCKDAGETTSEPAATPPPPVYPPDTVRFEFRLDGLQETYTLDDTIRAEMIAINRASTVPLCFSASHIPPYDWYVRRVGRTDYEFFYPIWVGPMFYSDTLRRGDTLRFAVMWTEEVFAPSPYPYPNLNDRRKAFSGQYEFCAQLPQSDLFEVISFPRTVTIKEQGTPWSAVLDQMGSSGDLVDVGMAVRNRVSGLLEFPIDDPYPVKVFFSIGADTALRRSYTLPFSTLLLQPFSDNMPFRFQRSVRDTIFAGMRGTYNMTVLLKLRDMDISASRQVVIYP